MTQFYGNVLSVETRNLGEPATAAASIGATSLSVNDAATFDEMGGVILVNGEQLAYTAIDADTNILTLAVPLVTAIADQDLIEVHPPAPVKTALVDLSGGEGEPTPATVPHFLLDRLPDGTRDAGTGESVTLEQRGTYEFIVTDVVAAELETQSLDYVEGEAGWGQAPEGVQVQDMQATGEIGADVVSAGVINLAGEDLTTMLANAPRGTQLLASKEGAGEIHAGITSGTTLLRLFRLAYGAVEAGRLYRISLTGLLQGSVASDVFDLKIFYTTDGSDPTTSSPIMPYSFKRVPVPGGNPSQTFDKSFFWPCPADGELKMALSLNRVAGTGTAYIYLQLPGYGFQWAVEDTGLSATATDPAALSQTAKSDGSGSDNPPITTKVLSWQPTHTEYFMGFGGRTGAADRTDYGAAQVGWQQDLLPFGNDRPDFSVLHFNHADIVSKLSTATAIDKVELKFKVKSRAAAAGLDLSVGAHKYASFPQSMAGDYVTEVAAGRIVTGQGSKNDAAPGSTYTITLNSAVGTNLKSGLYKGIIVTSTVFTAAGVGELFGNPSVDRPTLIITFKSP